ncbi:protein KRI1 homolog [Watersipora subatra]|uniref:protein KRI1 homolog n=1 Tax=Watersipora subatra TaxID=2589382 RepID=UPI00355C702C
MALRLSGFEDDNHPEIRLEVNKVFAKHYDKSRRSEELMKLKSRYGNVALDDSSETDSETEDEDAEELTADIEQKWLKTLAALKSNDPRIYDDKMHFFNSDDETSASAANTNKRKKMKRVTLKDMDRRVITEREGAYSDTSDLDTPIPTGKGYYEEQREIRESILKAQDISGSEEDEEGADLLKVKVKTAKEKEVEEEEYRKFVKGQEAKIDNQVEKDLFGLRKFWNRDDMSECDEFLKNYILEKKYLSQEVEAGNSSDGSHEAAEYNRVWSDSEDEQADKFELKYNFRFEEPDREFIKSYPRTVSATMRIQKSRRKEQREKVQERKSKEKQKRREELNRLRNLKKKEMKEKLELLKRKSGVQKMMFTEEELQMDFDPDDHDKKMKEMFPDDIDENDEEDLVKPVFDYDPDIDDAEDWDKYCVNATKSADTNEEMLDTEDPNFVMDADYDPNALTLNDRNFGLDGCSRQSKRKRNKFKRALRRKKPLFNPESKSFEEYLDEYYAVECEDMIGDIKCRFPYREVPANDYGLSVGEILSARDKELNSWSSLKKTVQYRSNEEEFRDVAKYRRKSHDITKKKRLLPSLFKEQDEEDTHMHETELVKRDTKSKVQGLVEVPEEAAPVFDPVDTATAKQPPSAAKSVSQKVKGDNSNRDSRRRNKWKDARKQTASDYEQSSRGMSFKRMEAYGMHSEVKRVKKLRSRDKRRN